MALLKGIVIDQQRAQIGVSSSPARMSISRPRSNMRVSSETSTPDVQTQIPRFKINRNKLYADLNLHTALDFTKQQRDKGNAAVFRGIKKSGENGDFLGNARVPGQKMGQLARKRAMERALAKKEFNIGAMPQNRAEFIWEPGSININWSKHSVVVDWDGDYMPQITIDRKYSVDVFLTAEPYIRISVQDIRTPGSPGQYIDSAI